MTTRLRNEAPAVLIVEDEPLIRMTAVDFIEDAGFQAVEASNADEAIAAIGTNPKISVLFTDIDMPGSMNGMELASLVSEKWPSIRIIVVSGHRKAEASKLPQGGVFFPKPYDITHITMALQTMSA